MEPISDLKTLPDRFISALVGDNPSRYDTLLSDDALMRIWSGKELEVFRPHPNIVKRLGEESSAWLDPTVEILSRAHSDQSIALEIRIQATEGARYVEHNRALFLKVQDSLITEIDLYCPTPIPSARRTGWKAPASLSAAVRDRLFDSEFFRYDIRTGVPLPTVGSIAMERAVYGSGDPHPGSNYVLGARWSAAQADHEIEALLTHHQSRNIGFSWLVRSFDTPPDLGMRLKRHGMILAGSTKVMALIGLEALAVPNNPEIVVKEIETGDQPAIDAGINIMKICFNLTPEQAARTRANWQERMSDPVKRAQEIRYLALLQGDPVGYARLVKDSSTSLLGGAATLPAYRGQKVYSSLLRRRLEDARDFGYEIVTIDAGPMASRVVARYGFEEIAQMDLYAWMPEIDMDVIRSLIPQD